MKGFGSEDDGPNDREHLREGSENQNGNQEHRDAIFLVRTVDEGIARPVRIQQLPAVQLGVTFEDAGENSEEVEDGDGDVEDSKDERSDGAAKALFEASKQHE